MTITRRHALVLSALSLLPSLAEDAHADSYPSRPIRIVSAFPAGGPNDTVARLIGQWISQRLGKPVFVENRPGAGGNIGTEVVVRSPPDGYTLLVIGPTNTVNAALYTKLSFNFLNDIEPIAGVMRVPNILAVSAGVPATSVPELISYAKANPGKLNMASAGIGSASHIAGELFKMMAGVDMTHVPYRGAAPALTDMLSGQTQVLFDLMPNSIEHVKAGRLRALAVTTTARTEALPDLPPLSEYIPGYESSSVYGIGAPIKTPHAIIELLNKEIGEAVKDAKIAGQLHRLGGEILLLSPSELRALLEAETKKWGKVVEATGTQLN